MKKLLFLLLLSVVFNLNAQEKLSESKKEKLNKIAESFLKDLYAGNYDSCLNNYDISYREDDFLLLNNVEEFITGCKGSNHCLIDPDFEFIPLHHRYKSVVKDDTQYEQVIIYYAYTDAGYSFINLSNFGKGWFVSYADVQPHHSVKWSTMSKLEKIINRKDQ